MNIDWFTFVAQIVNFLILVGLLRWLLYDPIVNAMKQREQKIAERWNEAEQTQALALENAARFEKQTSELESTREDLIREAGREAMEHRERLTREARDDVELKREEWITALKREQQETADEIRDIVGELATDSARRTLTELADADLEQLVTRKFIERLRTLEPEKRDAIATLLQDGDTSFRVRSSFGLDQDSRDQLRQAIKHALGHEGEVDFENSPDLICGLQLDAGGYSIEWNVDDFLRQIELDFSNRTRGHH